MTYRGPIEGLHSAIENYANAQAMRNAVQATHEALGKPAPTEAEQLRASLQWAVGQLAAHVYGVQIPVSRVFCLHCQYYLDVGLFAFARTQAEVVHTATCPYTIALALAYPEGRTP